MEIGMKELSDAISALAFSPESQAGEVRLFTGRRDSNDPPAHTCDVCTCNVTRCSGGPCCY
jgi:hypothetical protein